MKCVEQVLFRSVRSVLFWEGTSWEFRRPQLVFRSRHMNQYMYKMEQEVYQQKRHKGGCQSPIQPCTCPFSRVPKQDIGLAKGFIERPVKLDANINHYAGCECCFDSRGNTGRGY